MSTGSVPPAAAAPAVSLLVAVRPYHWRIALTYGLSFAENIFELLYPFAIGLAINGLVGGAGPVSLLPLAGIWLAHIATGVTRQMLDTRLFMRVYGEVAGGMILRQRAAGISTGEVAARTAMAREAIDFFEIELPAILTAVTSLVGSIAMLFLYDVTAGMIMAAVLVPVAAVNALYGRRALALSARLNDRHEREVPVIEHAGQGGVRAHFRALTKWRVMLSDALARSWSIAELFTLGAVMLVLLQITAIPGVQAGDVFAALAYVLTVLGALDQAPVIVQQSARLIDIRRRVEQTAE